MVAVRTIFNIQEHHRADEEKRNNVHTTEAPANTPPNKAKCEKCHCDWKVVGSDGEQETFTVLPCASAHFELLSIKIE